MSWHYSCFVAHRHNSGWHAAIISDTVRTLFLVNCRTAINTYFNYVLEKQKMHASKPDINQHRSNNCWSTLFICVPAYILAGWRHFNRWRIAHICKLQNQKNVNKLRIYSETNNTDIKSGFTYTQRSIASLVHQKTLFSACSQQGCNYTFYFLD